MIEREDQLTLHLLKLSSNRLKRFTEGRWEGPMSPSCLSNVQNIGEVARMRPNMDPPERDGSAMGQW
jgi:hypothetical protein